MIPCSCTNKEQITNQFAKKVFMIGNKPEIWSLIISHVAKMKYEVLPFLSGIIADQLLLPRSPLIHTQIQLLSLIEIYWLRPASIHKTNLSWWWNNSHGVRGQGRSQLRRSQMRNVTGAQHGPSFAKSSSHAGCPTGNQDAQSLGSF